MKEALLTIGIAILAVALIFGSAIVNWGWNRASQTEAELGPIESRPTVPYTPLPEARRFNGVALQIHNHHRLDEFRRCINEIADLGADTITLSVAAYQDNASSSVINIGARLAPTDEQFLDLIRLARSRGMRVIVMPIVLLNAPRGNEWRGRIIPHDPDRWWSDYREYITYYSRAAVAGGAEVVMIGSELNRMEEQVSRWIDLINYMRQEFPSLQLAYSANWDRYWKVRFWQHLDYAGVTSYYDLANHDEPTPTVEEIVSAWHQFTDRLGRRHQYKKNLEAWQRTIGKPVLFTELGWYSMKGVAMEPWNYYRSSTISLQEQANLYEAFLKVWDGHDIVGGFMFWEWTLDEGGPNDKGYTPRGKPAEQILRDYFSRVNARTGRTAPATAADD